MGGFLMFLNSWAKAATFRPKRKQNRHQQKSLARNARKLRKIWAKVECSRAARTAVRGVQTSMKNVKITISVIACLGLAGALAYRAFLCF